ncbi:MAG: triose-phosphate isomerase [Rhodospirillales bacterium]|nr:triose-phosphate isomerase [Rhodospirillales bacterium]
MKKLIAGNWKMNGSMENARALIANIINRLETDEDVLKKCDILVCPPFLHIPAVRHAIYGFPELRFGAQDCSAYENGAHTGDVSASMLRDSSCSYVIVGHSERRQYQGESDATVAQKAAQALKNDMVPIICVGETEEEREKGLAQEIVDAQLAGSIPALEPFHDIVVIAYEPVWAIGTGKTASVDDVAEMHGFIREQLDGKVPAPEKVRILYGGSMKPENAGELLSTENVDGGLIGGASLSAESFLAIARAAG